MTNLKDIQTIAQADQSTYRVFQLIRDSSQVDVKQVVTESTDRWLAAVYLGLKKTKHTTKQQLIECLVSHDLKTLLEPSEAPSRPFYFLPPLSWITLPLLQLMTNKHIKELGLDLTDYPDGYAFLSVFSKALVLVGLYDLLFTELNKPLDNKNPSA